jgi:lysophospholipase L1-like esterase
LEYAYDDWTVAQIAKALGKTDDYKRFMKRAYNYQNIFYPEKKFVWMKKKDGSWVENFSETGHSTFLGSGFVEGNAWQYTFFVPHDVQGMINLVGKDEFANRLEEGFKQSLPHKFNSEHLDENGLLGMGVLPINHGNQPNMQASYLFNYAGKPWLTQHWVREIMNNFYGDDIYAWPGDEDQGQMGGWFVMSSMGLFQMDGGCSTEPIYEIGSPIFKKSVIHLDKNYYKGGKFTIIANNVSDKNRYVQSAKLDGKPLNKAWFYHSELVDGGTLELEMGDKPNKSWGTKTPPPSMSSVLSAKEKEEILSYDPDAEFMRIWNLGIKAYYNHKKENFESLPNHKGEIIFLGNSLTDGCEWSEMFQNPKIKNRGIGGDDTDGVLGRLDEVIESKPKKIFIMIGTNDLSAGKSVDYIVDNYKKILDNIKAKSPKTKVFIQSELPVDDAIHTTRKNSDLQKINTRLKKIAKKRNLVFIDLYPKFFNGKKLDPKYSYDGLHVNGEGYKVWKSCIEKYVD